MSMGMKEWFKTEEFVAKGIKIIRTVINDESPVAFTNQIYLYYLSNVSNY
jgi:hypothetical protein